MLGGFVRDSPSPQTSASAPSRNHCSDSHTWLVLGKGRKPFLPVPHPNWCSTCHHRRALSPNTEACRINCPGCRQRYLYPTPLSLNFPYSPSCPYSETTVPFLFSPGPVSKPFFSQIPSPIQLTSEIFLKVTILSISIACFSSTGTVLCAFPSSRLTGVHASCGGLKRF